MYDIKFSFSTSWKFEGIRVQPEVRYEILRRTLSSTFLNIFMFVSILYRSFHAGRARFCEPMGAGKPTFPQPGGTSVPLTWVPMYSAGKVVGSVRRLSVRRPWGVAHPRSWCQGWDCWDKFPGTKVLWGPRLCESHLGLPSTVSRSPAGSYMAVHPYDSPTND